MSETIREELHIFAKAAKLMYKASHHMPFVITRKNHLDLDGISTRWSIGHVSLPLSFRAW